jgi:hypothetical protein
MSTSNVPNEVLIEVKKVVNVTTPTSTVVIESKEEPTIKPSDEERKDKQKCTDPRHTEDMTKTIDTSLPDLDVNRCCCPLNVAMRYEIPSEGVCIAWCASDKSFCRMDNSIFELDRYSTTLQYYYLRQGEAHLTVGDHLLWSQMNRDMDILGKLARMDVVSFDAMVCSTCTTTDPIKRTEIMFQKYLDEKRRFFLNYGLFGFIITNGEWFIKAMTQLNIRRSYNDHHRLTPLLGAFVYSTMAMVPFEPVTIEDEMIIWSSKSLHNCHIPDIRCSVYQRLSKEAQMKWLSKVNMEVLKSRCPYV